MSGLAHVMSDLGFAIRGSDITATDITAKLDRAGIPVTIGHNAYNLRPETDVVVVSSAIPKNNPEIEKALELGIPIVKRSYALGQIMKTKKGIAISGTHGKTTTTTMITLILKDAGLDPIALIGGEVKNIGGNFLTGKGQYFVAEACEYDRSFLDFYPQIAVITNVEADHLDYYRDLNEIKEAFKKFVKKIPRDGLLVFSMDDANAYEVAQVATCRVVGYGFSSRNRMENGGVQEYWEVEEVNQKVGETRFAINNGKKSFDFSLAIPGKHNIANACASIIVAHHLHIDESISRDFLRDFKGTKRRFEIKGERSGMIVIDDYAHHPTEIMATLEGVKKFYKGKKVLAIFEPHQYSRTRLLLSEFGQSFGNADMVIIPGIYAVRDSEEDKQSVTPQGLVDEIKRNGVEALYLPGYPAVVEYLKQHADSETVAITIGASNVYEVGEQFLDNI